MKKKTDKTHQTGYHDNIVGNAYPQLNSKDDNLSREAILESQQKRFQAIFNNINDLICEIDADGIYQYVNTQYKNTLGYDPEELLGQHATDLIHPDDLNTSLNRYEELKKTRTHRSDIWRFKHKNGNYRIIESRGKVIDDGSPDPHTVVVSRDITDQYNAELTIVASEKKYRGLYQSLMDGFAMVSMEGKIIEFNDVFIEMLGYSNEELLKLTYIDITPAKWHKTEHYIIENQVLKIGYSEVFRKEYKRKDGSVFPVELRIYLSSDEQKQPVCMWAIVRDINDAVKADENQLILYQRLEDMNSMKDKFMSIMAHDLRGHFNSILGYTEILRTLIPENMSSIINENIQRINQTAGQSFSLLENLLSWAYSQSNNLKFNPVKTYIQEIIAQTIAFYESASSLKSIHIGYDCHKDMIIEADIQMLKTMLRNLISNAIKFTPENGKITIKVVESDNTIIIDIENSNHKSITKASTRSIPSEFVSNNAVETLQGTGLGLILVQDFAQIHGGKLETFFNIDHISRVSLSLPQFRLSGH